MPLQTESCADIKYLAPSAPAEKKCVWHKISNDFGGWLTAVWKGNGVQHSLLIRKRHLMVLVAFPQS